MPGRRCARRAEAARAAVTAGAVAVDTAEATADTAAEWAAAVAATAGAAATAAMGGGGGGRSGSSTPSDGELKQGKSSVLNPPLELKVAQTETEIDVDDMVGKVRKLYPNGKKYKAEDADAEVKSSWHDGKLQVETRMSHGGAVTETWERVPDGSRLIVHVKVEGGFGKLELKRIYDRETPDTKTAS